MKTEGGSFEERKGPEEEYVCIDMAAGEGMRKNKGCLYTP